VSEVHHDKYEDHIARHDPREGFDDTEPDSKSIFGFVIGSVILLVAVILALQFYFDKVWSNMVEERVSSVPDADLGVQHNLEDWRLNHYEFTDKSKTSVRLPLDRAKALLLEEAKAGKTFYPAKPTEPKPETPNAPADAKGAAAPDAKGDDKGKAETKAK